MWDERARSCLRSNGVFKPDPGSHREKGGLEREEARSGRASGKKRACRPNGALSPDPRSRHEKGGLEHEGGGAPKVDKHPSSQMES